MCTSDTKREYDFEKTAYVYMFVTLFLILFGAIYEKFSHNVFSYAMIYSFIFPFGFGTVVNTVMKRIGAGAPQSLTAQMWHAGIITLTLGCIVSGAFQIYGSGNMLLNVYYIAGIALLAGAGIKYFLEKDNVLRREA